MNKGRAFIWFWLAVFCLIPVFGFASGLMTYPLTGEIVVTSPYGWREHPTLGGQRYHSGLDMAAEYGQAVHAAAPGMVTLAGWVSGYGYTVILDHGGGVETLYGHNESLAVSAGQTVKQGEMIALAGSTGYSTGPHCHFEVRENGVTVDPNAYLAPGSVAEGDIGSFFQSDYNFIPLDFDSYFDFAKPFREAVEVFAKACRDAMELIRSEVMWLFVALLTIDFALAAFWTLFFNHEVEFIQWLMKKMLFYGFLVFLMTHWGDIVLNTARDYFASMGAAAAGSTQQEAGLLLSDPTEIVQLGARLVTPIFAHIGQFSGVQVMENIAFILCGLLAALAILACYALIGLQFALAYLEFYLVGLFTFISMSFSGLKQTRFFAANGITAVFQVSIKLMFFCLFALLLTNTAENFIPTSYYAQSGKAGDLDLGAALDFLVLLKILLASMLFVLMGNRMSKIVLKIFGSGGFRFGK